MPAPWRQASAAWFAAVRCDTSDGMRRALWAIARRILFALDAESAHRLTVRLLRWTYRLAGGRALRILSGASGLPSERARVWDIEFSSRLGLAAGFDKDGEIISALPHLGFGFVEVGTVTPRPQAGNERPRLFRDPARRALFNRMGFNGAGAEQVAAALRIERDRITEGFRVGVNVGKNKETPAERASEDYEAAIAPFEGLADYAVINVSSPNTPGLRDLQAIEALRPIVAAVLERVSRWRKAPPVLLKLAPELGGEELLRILEAGESWGVRGWVLTNTLAGTRVEPKESVSIELTGGWSGSPLSDLALRRLRDARGRTRLPIISVGGILSEADAVTRVREGADLVQVYSGWVFGGPDFPARVSRALSGRGATAESG